MGKGDKGGPEVGDDSGNNRLHSECEFATLVLDRQLRITSFTPSIRDFMALGDHDTGRPLADIPRIIDDPDLIPDCRRVLAQAGSVAKELHHGTDTYIQRCCLPLHTPGMACSGVIVNYLDFPGCKRTLKAMEVSQEHLRMILETAVDGIIEIDAHGLIKEFNPAAERMFGYRADEILGRNVKVLMPAPYREHHDEYLARYRETGQAHIIGIGREVSALRKDGTELPVELSISELVPRTYFLGFVRDLSQRRALEKELLTITEQAQRELGQYLHDDIGQEMTALALKVETLQEMLTRPGSGEEELASDLLTCLERTRYKVRNMARGLIPVPVDARGLTLALRELASEVSVTYNIVCIFSCEDDVMVADPTIATHLYRIAQEAINNAIRHGKATHIHVSLCKQDNDLYLIVEDDGRGIMESAMEKPGMGLKIMQHRCGIIGGTLIVGPGEPYGTRLACHLPMPDGNA